MGQVILCIGKKAQKPYCFEKLGVRVWTVEEVCLCLRENAFLLDEDSMSAPLVRWIQEECGLTELAAQLTPMVRQRGNFAVIAVKILEYVGMYDTQVLTHIGQTLQTGASLSDYEKKKKKGDYLVENQRYAKAVWEYDWLLAELPWEEAKVRAAVLHNKGVAMTGLFLFEEAAELFLEAWEQERNEEYYRDYLAAKRMLYDDKEYIGFVAELPDAYELSLKLEREVDGILEDWEHCEEYRKLQELSSCKEEGQKALYYEEIDMRIQALKNRYRENTCV